MKSKKLLIASIFTILLISLVIVYASLEDNTNNLNEKVDGRACTMDYRPVCGVNGITYGNECMAQETTIAYEGECLVKDPGAICTEEYYPVCGIDGKTYSNKCDAEVRNGIKVVSDGECSLSEGTFPVGEVPQNLSDEELASS